MCAVRATASRKCRPAPLDTQAGFKLIVTHGPALTPQRQATTIEQQ